MLLVAIRIGTRWTVTQKFFILRTNTYHNKLSMFARVIFDSLNESVIRPSIP